MEARPRPKKVLPHCVGYNALKPGLPFNPFKLFWPRSIWDAIMSYPKLSLATKAVWVHLAHQVAKRGSDMHGERELARNLSITRVNLRRHLLKLKKRRLLLVWQRRGKVDWRFLLYHQIFANCSRRGGIEIDTSVVSKLIPLVVSKSIPTDIKPNKKIYRDDPALTKSTGSSAEPLATFAPPGPGNGNKHALRRPHFTIEGREVFLQNDALKAWRDLPATAKGTRMREAQLYASDLIRAEEKSNSADPTIAEEGRQQYNEAFIRLQNTWFAITARKQKTPIQ